ncbi:hypothetical protein CALVIDRAFT_427729 [Calocera viscosa TUFC12733]|uniref:Uncharacterized protein n=1 Tax=Calocera viscosa (strain TUFC12733) TaxID=1330018 RepID=A0A167PLL0_CALVF|nr:hypothetical protein CALVIDRAFT_427729 [Calocera viscosa TUFC12733]
MTHGRAPAPSKGTLCTSASSTVHASAPGQALHVLVARCSRARCQKDSPSFLRAPARTTLARSRERPLQPKGRSYGVPQLSERRLRDRSGTPRHLLFVVHTLVSILRSRNAFRFSYHLGAVTPVTFQRKSASQQPISSLCSPLNKHIPPLLRSPLQRYPSP